MLREKLVRAKMPELLHYLAMIESSYQTDIGRPVAALGLWPFMPRPQGATAFAWKAVSTNGATRGAPPRLPRAVARTASVPPSRMSDPFSDRCYWRCVESNLLPMETADYVPRFMAAAVAGEGGLPSDDALAAAGFWRGILGSFHGRGG
ncbi:MAG TPA: hypothetical protein VKM54_18365 [Myxococcota bacterium]|nr:hypothetical protein [Myxococcota bacterium]